jgi:hypothetical protein
MGRKNKDGTIDGDEDNFNNEEAKLENQRGK